MNRSFFWANCSFTHFWAKNEWFAWKTDEWISSPERKLLIRIRNKLVKATVEQSILSKLSKKETLDQNILSKLSIKETVYQNILSKMSKGNSWSEYTEQAVCKGNSWSEYTEHWTRCLEETVYQNILNKVSEINSWSEYTEQDVWSKQLIRIYWTRCLK